MATKVPAKHIARFAHAVEQQYGQSKSDAVTSGLAKSAKTGNAAKKLHGLLLRAKLKADVPVEKLPCEGIPVLYMTHWIEALKKSGQLRRLTGGLRHDEVQYVLQQYWARIRTLYPDHEVSRFIEAGTMEPGRCIPMFIHTDEGRGLKRQGVMVVSSSPALGRGTAKQKAQRVLENKLSLNFMGCTEGNRFVHVAVQKHFYDQKPEKYQAMLSWVAMNCRILFDDGFEFQNERWHLVYLHSIGDWPAHVKNGNLLRHFGNGIKRADTDPQLWKGICHICCAGIQGIPWEHYSLDAISLKTVGLVEAWEDPGALLSLIVYESSTYEVYAPDVWHNWALGWGKETTASAAVLAVPYFEGSNIEDKVISMNEAIAKYLVDRPGQH